MAPVYYQIKSVYPLQIQNDQVVNVTFQTNNASSSDWIAAYSPPISIQLLHTTSPVKYGWCDESSTYLSQGFGNLLFNLTNLRTDVAFYYFTGGTYSPILANATTSSMYVSFRDENQPLRPRVVPTGNPDIFHLLWSSNSSQKPQLQWGVKTGRYTTFIYGNSSHINRTSLCGGPANSTGWRDMGLIHTAAFIGMSTLTAGSFIYYRFGDNATADFSPERSLIIPALAGKQPSTRPTTVALYCDLGRGSLDDTYTWDKYGRPSINTTMAVGNLVLKGEIDAVFHGGDISYATGYEAVWDFFLDQISPIASGALYLTTVGNHESDWPGSASYYTGIDSGGECGVPATTLLPMPYPATVNQPWWSYDVGLIHIIGMSTEHNYTRDSPQYNWLKNDLRKVNRTLTPWILFNGHRPMYINSDYYGSPSADLNVMNLMIQELEPLLWKYRVNLAFYGHNHAVQRHSAVLNKTVVQASTTVYTGPSSQPIHLHQDPQATVHMVVGTGGAAFTMNAVTPYPAWNEMVMYEYGYVIATAVNATYLNWEWFNSNTGLPGDHVVITQTTDWSEPWVIPTPSSSSTSSSGNGGGLSILATALIVGFSFFFVIMAAGFGGYYYYRTKRNDISSPQPNLEDFAVTPLEESAIAGKKTDLA
eukprot:gene22753-29460_t